jgi:hypothetical protein
VIGGGGYNEMVKIPRTPKWSPKIPKLWVMKICKLITPSYDL